MAFFFFKSFWLHFLRKALFSWETLAGKEEKKRRDGPELEEEGDKKLSCQVPRDVLRNGDVRDWKALEQLCTRMAFEGVFS